MRFIGEISRVASDAQTPDRQSRLQSSISLPDGLPRQTVLRSTGAAGIAQVTTKSRLPIARPLVRLAICTGPSPVLPLAS